MTAAATLAALAHQRRAADTYKRNRPALMRLALSEGATVKDIAAAAGVHRNHVYRILGATP